ncbi:methyltransferase [Sphingomonas sp. SRS2]|nr:methyltransferase [Sphingomonas sp. SRS2]
MIELLDDFGRAAVDGLGQPRKTIPARFFYDRRGSELFEEITRLPEYYPTRTERALLMAHSADIARLTGVGHSVVEFGSGSSAKTPILLDAVRPAAYVPIDISADFLKDSSQQIAAAYPDIRVRPLAGNFTAPIALPNDLDGPLIGFFPGSTIGNFAHPAAVDLLRSFRATLGTDARLVIGIDTRKNPRLLEAAYDDAAGVTAQFNLNMLHRMNRELDGTIDIEDFEHRVQWHNALGRIEMHLESVRDIEFRVAGRRFSMRAGETIHTENSYKYSVEEARLLARSAGWEPVAYWTDCDAMFGLHVWQATARGIEP